MNNWKEPLFSPLRTIRRIEMLVETRGDGQNGAENRPGHWTNYVGVAYKSDHLAVRDAAGLPFRRSEADDCTYTAYWDAANPVACSEKDVLVSVYRRGDKLLAVCGSWSEDAREVALSLKSGAITAAKNAETDAPVPVTGGIVRFRLAKHDLALIELLTRPEAP